MPPSLRVSPDAPPPPPFSFAPGALLIVGEQTDRKLGRITLSTGTLSTFNTLAIVFLLPVYDVIASAVAKRRATNHKAAPPPIEDAGGALNDLPPPSGITAGFTRHTIRILVGHAVTVVAMLSAVPPSRAAAAAVAANGPLPSVFTLAAPFFLVGAAEVGASVGMLELAFVDAPHGARSLLQAVSLLTVAVGNYLASAFTAVVQSATGSGGRASWIPAQGAAGRMDLYFLVLAGIAAVNAAVFAGLVCWYRPRRLVVGA